MSFKDFIERNRPAEPYLWDREHMDDGLLARWHEYVEALEAYAKGLDEKEMADDEVTVKDAGRRKRLYEVCYHETLGRTVYIRAEDDEDLRNRAHRYFNLNPLSYDEFLDYSMDFRPLDGTENIDESDIAEV